MKKVIISLFCVLINLVNAQDLVSLKVRLNQEQDRQKIETYLDISKLPIPRDTTLVYLNKAIVLAKKIDFDTIYPIQFAQSVSYYFKGNLIAAKEKIRLGFDSYRYTKDSTATLGHINMLLGVFNEALNEIDSAKYYYNKTITLLEKEKSNKSIEIRSNVYTNYANLYLKSGKYSKAISIYLQADRASQSVGDDSGRITALNNTAGCFKEMKQYDKSLFYYNESLELANKLKDNNNIAAINIGIGQTLLLLNNYKEALPYFELAQGILEKTDFNSLLHIVYQNLAEVYLNLKNIPLANQYIDKALRGVSQVKDDFSKASMFYTKSILLLNQNKSKQALDYINKSLLLAKKNQYNNILKESIEVKIQLIKQSRNHSELPLLYDELLVLKDSILNKVNLKQIADIETKYQTEKKEKENLVLKAANATKALALEKATQRKKLLLYGLSASALLAIAFWRRYQIEHKAKKIISNHKNEIEAQKNIIENLQKDLHHRVKNNLAIIDALVEDIKKEFSDKGFNLKLDDLQNRIKSINEVHEQLYKNKDITNLKLKEYVAKLAQNVQQSFGDNTVTIHNSISEKINIPVTKSFPIGLIINEFLTNSFKYAFKGKSKGEININLKEQAQNYILELSDDGIGLPKDFDLDAVRSFGMDVMQLLTEQLGGEFSLDGSNGVQIQIQFSKE